MAQQLTTISQELSKNVGIYYALIVEANVKDPQTKAILIGMSSVVLSICDLLIQNAETGGKLSKADGIKFAASHLIGPLKMIDQDKINCATALFDLAITAEAAGAMLPTAIAAATVAGPGSTLATLLVVYNACAVLAAIMSVGQSCSAKVATLQWIEIRADAYMARANIA